MTESNGKSESNPKEGECYQALTSERKKRMEIIENWYQSYYLWNTAYMANFLMNSSIVSYGPTTLPGEFFELTYLI